MLNTMPAFMLTQTDVAEQLRQAGWAPGMAILVHTSLKQIGGWVPGGTGAIIGAMLDVLGPTGTLMMPTFTMDNSEPSYWQNPPVPAAWWPTVRAATPAYNPQTTPTRMMGILAEHFRTWPGIRRSVHPQGSFAAWGHHADTLTADHDLVQQFGEASPLGRLYALDGHVFLLGVGHGNNTSLHLAEERRQNPKRAPQGSAMWVDGACHWVTFETVDYDDADFVQLGAAYEAAFPKAVQVSTLGKATVRLMRQRPLVDFAVEWLNTQRAG
ncbi:MAG: aminoglycoside N(3)-acetyltransferase [Anaerolineales bacterium]